MGETDDGTSSAAPPSGAGTGAEEDSEAEFGYSTEWETSSNGEEDENEEEETEDKVSSKSGTVSKLVHLTIVPYMGNNDSYDTNYTDFHRSTPC